MKFPAIVWFSMLVVPSAALADVSFDKALRKFEPRKQVVIKQATNAMVCTNFDGLWTGTCTDSDGVTEDSKTTILQSGCDDVRLDDRFSLGDAHSETTAKHGAQLTYTIQSSWSSNQTAINIAMNGSSTSFTDSSSIIFVGFIRLTTASGRLLTEQSTTSKGVASGGTIGSTYTQSCAYDRVN